MTTPGTMDLVELAKFDALAHRYWDPRGEFRPLHRLNPVRVRYIADRVPLAATRLLDVGCGGGLLAEAMADVGANVCAIDLAPSMIEVARLHAIERELSIDYRVASAESLLNEHSAAFDVITCMEMLEHVPEPAALLGTFAALLRPGGHLFISTINRGLKSFALAIVAAEYVLRLLPRGTHEYERFIRPSELSGLARRHGLQLVDIAGIEFDPFTERAALTGDPAVNYITHFVNTSVAR